MTGWKRSSKYSHNKFFIKVVSGVLSRGYWVPALLLLESNVSCCHQTLTAEPGVALSSLSLGVPFKALTKFTFHSITSSCCTQKTDNPLMTDCWYTSPQNLPSKEWHAQKPIQRARIPHRQHLLPFFFPDMHPEIYRTHIIIKTCQFICFMSFLSNLSQTSIDPIQVSQIKSISF